LAFKKPHPAVGLSWFRIAARRLAQVQSSRRQAALGARAARRRRFALFFAVKSLVFLVLYGFLGDSAAARLMRKSKAVFNRPFGAGKASRRRFSAVGHLRWFLPSPPIEAAITESRTRKIPERSLIIRLAGG
jgi:hypothetical protein